MRVWYNGSTSDFQSDDGSSILPTRSENMMNKLLKYIKSIQSITIGYIISLLLAGIFACIGFAGLHYDMVLMGFLLILIFQGMFIIDPIIKRIHKLEKYALTDELTGAPNRRAFIQAYKLALRRVQRTRESLALVVIDLDDFKLINDIYGHSIGDSVLKEFVNKIDKKKRDDDFFARFGGDEFCFLLPNVCIAQAVKVMEAHCSNIYDNHFAIGNRILPISFSAGIARIDDMEDFDKVFKRADKNLYEAKRLGKKQICARKIN